MPSLSHVEAVERAGLVRVDRYQVDLDLTGARDQDDIRVDLHDRVPARTRTHSSS